MTGICKVFIVISVFILHFSVALTKMILPVINLALEIKSANRQRTVAIDEVLCLKNAAALLFTSNEELALMAIEKIKILGPFWSYQLDSTANPAHLPTKGPN